MPDHHLSTSTVNPCNELISETNVLELTENSKVIYTEPDTTGPLITENNIDFENCVLLQLDDINSTVIIETKKDNFKKSDSQKSALQLNRKSPYGCAHCGHSFAQKRNLQTHLRRFHKSAAIDSKKKNVKIENLNVDNANTLTKNIRRWKTVGGKKFACC